VKSFENLILTGPISPDARKRLSPKPGRELAEVAGEVDKAHEF
jgi:hypothetical protein